ncbi:hypothetical protein BSL78_15663 [Apostichopus japonicus]|uniref:DOCKER domain-containing protein n=1 Tax=Stichopus japonicus TaxID=307972 RepID=A0A2G8KHM4_STIJA|nr:hypothetical protein BSL78_15663 [Apostichopus japonicus]
MESRSFLMGFCIVVKLREPDVFNRSSIFSRDSVAREDSSHDCKGTSDLLVWSEIIDSQVYERTPLEKSLEDIESKIEEVQNKHRRHRSHQEEPLPPLTQVLNGTVDAAVMGGISKIREYFLSDSYLVENPDDAHKVELLKELINRQLFVLDEALTYHGYSDPIQFNRTPGPFGEEA